jgi:hypothetical protein
MRPPSSLLAILVLAMTASAQAPSLVVHYKLDETSGTLVSDSSGNGLDAQTMGGTSWVPGLFGGGLDLDEGLNGHIATPHDPLHDVAQLTIAAWINVDLHQNYDGVLTKGTNVSPYSLMLSAPDAKFKFQSNNMNPPNGTGGGIYVSSGNLTTDQWHHIAVTFDGQVVSLYLDGALDSVHNASGVILGTTTEDLILGGDFPGGDEYFDGTLDDVRLYDGPLTADEIAELHGGSVGVPYCFGDGSGTPCPCGNAGASDSGCANSTGGGASIGIQGVASVVGQSFVLTATGLPANQLGVFFQGNNAINAGLGVPFGDGLRCAGGAARRLQIVNSDQNGATQTTVDVALRGGVAAGDLRRYQLWYGDPGTPCGALFNLSNATEITWQA